MITVIELLSPTNKRRASTGRAEYLTKREAVLSSKSHLVELDLLRGGERPPLTIEATSDYLALVSRVERRPRAQAFTWSVRQPLPQIPIPLGKGHADVSIDLAAAVDHVYGQARYDLSLDYGRPLDPPWAAEDASWAEGIITNRKPA